MKFSSSVSLALAAAPFLVSAAPARFYGKRAASDILVLQFAHTLERLESQFYDEALAKFQESDFTSAGFGSSNIPVEQFKNIFEDEKTHTVVLASVLKSLGETPLESCKFKFDSVLGDVATMAATARVVEYVGVAAYMGAAPLLTDPVLLTSAASIMTVESRHSSILNLLSGSGTAIPSAFDMALKPNEVLAIAGGFLDGPCDLGVPANPALTITNTGPVGPGTLLTFSSPAMNGTVAEDKMFCQMMLGGQPMSISLPMSECRVPEGINGPVGIWITSDPQPLINNARDRAETQLVAGPTLTMIDTIPESLGQLARGSSGSVGGSSGSSDNSGSSTSSASDSSATATTSAEDSASTSTRTISPAEASAIISSASDSSAVPTGTDSASGAEPTANNNVANPAANTTPGKPNSFVGKSPDGHVTVNGWKGI